MNRRIVLLALLTCLSGIAIVAFPIVDAALPESGAPHEPNAPQHIPLEKLSIVTGKVASWTTSKGGDTDGFKVSEDVVVHFPPHHGKQVSAWLQLEDDVTIFAKLKPRPDGSEVMEAVVIQRGDDAMQVPGPKPHHLKPHDGEPHGGKSGPGHAGNHEEQLMSVRGKVTEMHENREGIVDGFLIDAKTEVKFPPHQSTAITANVQVGSEVVVDGRRHETPKGDVHLHADRISSGDSVVPIDRPGPKRHEGPPPHAKKDPKGNGGPKGDTKHDDDHGQPPHVQIVDELRKIREVLEEKGSR